MAVLAEARREEGDERDQRDLPDPERRVGPPHVVVQVGRGRAEADRPRRGLVLARREDAAGDAVGLVPEPLHAVPAEEEVGLRGGLRLEDHAGGRSQVVLDPLARQTVASVEEDHPAGGDGLAGLGVDLDPVGLEADVPLLDLDGSLGDQELLPIEVLDAVGVDGDRGPGLQGEPLAFLGLAETGKEGEPQGGYEPDADGVRARTSPSTKWPADPFSRRSPQSK